MPDDAPPKRRRLAKPEAPEDEEGRVTTLAGGDSAGYRDAGYCESRFDAPRALFLIDAATLAVVDALSLIHI